VCTSFFDMLHLLVLFALCVLADRPVYNCIEEFMSGPHWPAPLSMYTP